MKKRTAYTHANSGFVVLTLCLGTQPATLTLPSKSLDLGFGKVRNSLNVNFVNIENISVQYKPRGGLKGFLPIYVPRCFPYRHLIL